eukprot:g11716.t1
MVDLAHEEQAMRNYLDGHHRSAANLRSNSTRPINANLRSASAKDRSTSAEARTRHVPLKAMSKSAKFYNMVLGPGEDGFNPYCPHKLSGRACTHNHGGVKAHQSPGRRTRVPVRPIVIPSAKASQADVVLMRGYVARMMKKLREGMRLLERENLNREHKHEVQSLIDRFEAKERLKEQDFVDRQNALQASIAIRKSHGCYHPARPKVLTSAIRRGIRHAFRP